MGISVSTRENTKRALSQCKEIQFMHELKLLHGG